MSYFATCSKSFVEIGKRRIRDVGPAGEWKTDWAGMAQMWEDI